MTVASYYGISGSTCDERKSNLNELLLSKAIQKLAEAENPYILCGDFNVNPEDYPTIVAAVNSGLVIDVGHTWAPCDEHDLESPTKVPENTYSSEKPVPGMKGKGVSGIDDVLANPAAAVAVAVFRLRWDLVEESHVPLQLQL